MVTKIVFQKNVRELRLILCQKSSSSAGMREFIQKHYTSLKANNPNTPILIRESENIEPRLFARFDLGKELTSPMSNVSSDGVLKKIAELSV